MNTQNMYWRHRSGNRLSEFHYDDPSELLEYCDKYYEDFYIARATPSVMMLRTVGFRHCSPDYHFEHMTFSGRYAMMFILDGEGYVDGNPVTEGTIVFFDRRRSCNFSTNPEKLCSYAWITFVDGVSDELIEMIGLSNHNMIYRTENIIDISRIFYDMLYVKHPNTNVEMYMEASLLRLLSLSEYRDGKEAKDVAKGNQRHINAAIWYITNNFKSKSFRISDISDKVGISENYLRALFKSEMGISIRDYVIDLRIQTAKTLLKNSNYNISEIASFCGYKDYRQFSEQFKKKTKVSPSKYKES